MTSEQKHGIAKQPQDTCPLLDGMLTKMLKAHSKIEEALGNDEITLDDIRDLIIGLHSALIEDGQISIENIRERVIEIRAWGQAWKEFTLTEAV